MDIYKRFSLMCQPIGSVAWKCIQKKKYDLQETAPTNKTFTLLPFTKTFTLDRMA